MQIEASHIEARRRSRTSGTRKVSGIENRVHLGLTLYGITLSCAFLLCAVGLFWTSQFRVRVLVALSSNGDCVLEFPVWI